MFGERLDCYSAVAVHTTQAGGGITIRAFAADYYGTRSVRVKQTGSDADAVVSAVFKELIRQGAMELVCAETRS